MAVIDLSATMNGSAEMNAGARLSMSLQANLLGRSASGLGHQPAPAPEETPKPEALKTGDVK